MCSPLLLILLLPACTSAPKPGQPLTRRGDEIMVAGQLFHTGAPVVLWTDPGGYDAYRTEKRFVPWERAAWTPPEGSGGGGGVGTPNRYGLRYASNPEKLPPDLRERVRGGGWDLPTLQSIVDQFVIHYDVCGTSRQCFKILHDHRGLSVHFMLDIDGTIYQTLDLKERAWHGGTANDRSIGIEIANIGAYPPSLREGARGRATESPLPEGGGWGRAGEPLHAHDTAAAHPQRSPLPEGGGWGRVLGAQLPQSPAADGRDRRRTASNPTVPSAQSPLPAPLNAWYTLDEDGRTRITLPTWMGDGGVRTPNFIGRPARNDPIIGPIHGQQLIQFDLTPEQYDSLIKLTAALCEIFPNLPCDYPRDQHGQLITTVLSDDQLAAHRGLIGHYHITRGKIDPGPAFQWDMVTTRARAMMRSRTRQ